MATPPHDTAAEPPRPEASSSNAVEMTNLPSATSNSSPPESSETPAPSHSLPAPSSADPASQIETAPSTTEPANGASQPNASNDSSPPAEGTAQADVANGPAVLITLLLVRNNARHDFRIDEKYLKRRNIEKEPWEISVYNMKELILRDWRQDWEEKPGTPAAIRLISFGRELDDKDSLKACRLSTDNYNVVHMTIRPQEPTEEEDARMGKSAGRDRANSESSPGCCSCVIL